MSDCKKPYSIEHILNTDVDDLATVPDYFVGVRTLEDPSTGVVKATPVRVPGARVMPTGNLSNVAALTTNNTTISVPENQVLAGYYDVQPGGNVMRLANASHRAQFLIVSNYTNGKVLAQVTGFLSVPGGHRYIVGQQYYLGANGQPTTDSSVTGQKLFMPLDENIVNVNGGF